MSRAYNQIKYLLYCLAVVILSLFVVTVYFSFQLPDDSNLKSYKPDVMTRIHDSNGQLVKEFSREYRIFVPIENIPVSLKNAFISAEDKNFYNHIGIDPTGILRALIRNTYYFFFR